MGLLTATCGSIVGFIFAYATVRCNIPGKKVIHWLALLPTVSPPFALALSTILLFGRNGVITKHILGIDFVHGMNDIYGMDGLVFVQTITFFSVAYLILRAMLERLNPAMEEAAASLGAGRLHIFLTVTLPLLIPGIAGSFLLLFVESLADLGNPLFISGNVTVLSSQIFLSVIGEYNYQKASALSLVLLIPTLVIFLVQRYYVNRRSYISVTGKPTGTHMYEKDPLIRWVVNGIAYLLCALIIVLYITIIYGSFSTAWGVDFTPTLKHWNMTITRGCRGHPGYHFPELVGYAFCRHPWDGDRLAGCAQAIWRERSTGFHFQPGWGSPRHDPGYRFYPGLQHSLRLPGNHRLCHPGIVLGPGGRQESIWERLIILTVGTAAGYLIKGHPIGAALLPPGRIVPAGGGFPRDQQAQSRIVRGHRSAPGGLYHEL